MHILGCIIESGISDVQGNWNRRFGFNLPASFLLILQIPSLKHQIRSYKELLWRRGLVPKKWVNSIFGVYMMMTCCHSLRWVPLINFKNSLGSGLRIVGYILGQSRLHLQWLRFLLTRVRDPCSHARNTHYEIRWPRYFVVLLCYDMILRSLLRWSWFVYLLICYNYFYFYLLSYICFSMHAFSEKSPVMFKSNSATSPYF